MAKRKLDAYEISMYALNGQLINIHSDETWRDMGRYNQLYKLWLINCAINPGLEECYDLICVICKYILSESFNACIYNGDQRRTHCLYNIPLRVFGDQTNGNENVIFMIGQMSFTFYKLRHKYAIRFENRNTKRTSVIYTDKHDWDLYDYLLMLSEKEFFCLDIGPVADRLLYDDKTQPNHIFSLKEADCLSLQRRRVI